MKNCGFSLAEILVTLAIIGVVASLTIPVIINNTQNQETVTKVRKMYSSLYQITEDLKREYGSLDNLPWGDYNDPQGAEAVMNIFASKMRVLKNCGTRSGCWATVPHTSLSGNDIVRHYDKDSSYAKVLLSDGSSIALVARASDCTHIYLGLENRCGVIAYDVNGARAPNKLGKDLHEFVVTKDKGLVPKGVNRDNCRPGGNGEGCTMKILRDSNINW